MSELVWKAGVQREKGFLYYILDGAVVRVPMKRAGHESEGSEAKSEVVCRGDFVRDPSYVYYLDKDGNVSRAQKFVTPPPSPSSRAELVAKTGAPREEGYFYFVRDRAVMRAPYTKASEPELVCALDGDKQPGYRYFVNAEGDVVRLKK